MKSPANGPAVIVGVMRGGHASQPRQKQAFMRSRENLIRQRRFEVNRRRRHLLQLDIMIAEFARMAHALELQIVSEEKKSGIGDLNWLRIKHRIG